MTNGDVRDKATGGNSEQDVQPAVFGINAVQLVVGVIAIGAGLGLLVADIGQNITAFVAMIYGFMAIIAFTKGRISIYGDRVVVDIPSVAKKEIPLEEVMKVERDGSSIRVHVKDREKPIVLPWWIVRPSDVDPIASVLEERCGTHAPAGQEV